MGTKRYRIGALFSTTGPYSVVPQSMLNGALLGFDEISRTTDLDLEVVIIDPQGDLARYRQASLDLLNDGIRHVVGCYTSSSRKEVIPCFEKYDGILWYPSHYEGFESSDNVIYTGASPNQHVLPLVEYMVQSVGRRAFCVGSNYIWAWENNRIFREVLSNMGGSVLAERYFPVGDVDLGSVCETIVEQRPDFVFSNLIGTSAYAFLKQLRVTCSRHGIDQPKEIPVASCTLAEPELSLLGPDASDGHYSSSVYFSTVQTPENAPFLTAYNDRFPEGPAASADAEASYIAVKLLAEALVAAGTDEAAAVRAAVAGQSFKAPQGEVRVDPETFHTWLTPRIGRSTGNTEFQVLVEAAAPIRPDPYLVESSMRYALTMRPPLLKVVR